MDIGNLEQVLRYLKNWFIAGIYPDRYTVEDGIIDLPFLQEGQYFRVMGSVFNDGLYRYGPDMPQLTDESFRGTVWALAVPRQVVELSGEIAAWRARYGNVLDSPYQSESFGGYSYVKDSGAINGSDGAGGWQAVFRDRLAGYRKVREI